jgi:hypothetical protein
MAYYPLIQGRWRKNDVSKNPAIAACVFFFFLISHFICNLYQYIQQML